MLALEIGKTDIAEQLIEFGASGSYRTMVCLLYKLYEVLTLILTKLYCRMVLQPYILRVRRAWLKWLAVS